MIHDLLVLILAGMILWAATTYLPIHDTIKKVMVAFVVIVVILWLLRELGVPWFDMSLPRLRH